MPETSGLTIRQHERKACWLVADFEIVPEQREQVRFSPTSEAVRPHMLRGYVRDISVGGLGLTFEQFVPMMTEAVVRVFPLRDRDELLAEHVKQPIFEHRVKVRRVYCISRDPAYVLGVAFVEPTDDLAAMVARVQAVSDRLDEGAEDA